jgi:hypothetical protein
VLCHRKATLVFSSGFDWSEERGGRRQEIGEHFSNLFLLGAERDIGEGIFLSCGYVMVLFCYCVYVFMTDKFIK